MGLSDKVKLQNSIPSAAKTLTEMAHPKYVSQDKSIPRTLLKNCKGIAFINIYKAGLFMIGGQVGGGCVIVKIPDSNDPKGYRWSAPLSVRMAGLQGGFIFGGEKISSVIILNTQGAIDSFRGDKQVKFGGSLSLAAGPTGRDAAAAVSVSDNKKLAPAYSYSIAKGAYIGATLDGTVLQVDAEDNQSFYGPGTTADMILDGTVQIPLAANALFTCLDECIGTSSASLATSGKDLLNESLSNSDLPPGWQTLYSDGKPYYYNEATNTTQWEKPEPVRTAAPVPPRPPAPPVSNALPAGWDTLYTEDGKPYYYNAATNVTQWEKP